MNKRVPKFYALLAGIGLLTAGCSDGTDDLQAYVHDLERKPTQRVPDIRTPTAYPDLGYAPETLRNPFAVHSELENQTAKETKTAAADTDRIREPLESEKIADSPIGGRYLGLLGPDTTAIAHIDIG